jgi:hypothetical protein
MCFLKLLRPSLFAFCAAALAIACNGNPTVQEVIDQSSPPICEKLKECSPASFPLAYPGGVDECVTKTKDASAKKYGSDLSKHSVCTDEEVSKCLNDFKAQACPADGSSPTVPCNC